MEDFASYILNETNLPDKMIIAYYLSRKEYFLINQLY